MNPNINPKYQNEYVIAVIIHCHLYSYDCLLLVTIIAIITIMIITIITIIMIIIITTRLDVSLSATLLGYLVSLISRVTCEQQENAPPFPAHNHISMYPPSLSFSCRTLRIPSPKNLTANTFPQQIDLLCLYSLYTLYTLFPLPSPLSPPLIPSTLVLRATLYQQYVLSLTISSISQASILLSPKCPIQNVNNHVIPPYRHHLAALIF